jgi:hypothetical protein
MYRTVRSDQNEFILAGSSTHVQAKLYLQLIGFRLTNVKVPSPSGLFLIASPSRLWHDP